jgi:tetraacyldisaccharide 4'-kinase
VEYLLRLLQGYRTAALSRGYKRKSKGFVLADETASAASLGDEPFQYYRDFPGVTVAVSESRVAGIENLQKLRQELEVVVLDDAMQHRPVQPSLNILLTDYARLFYKDRVLPAGLLREPKQGARRADLIVVSKCPAGMGEEEQQAIVRQIGRYSRPAAPVFFSTFRYGTPVPIGSSRQVTNRVILLTGIANPSPLVRYLQEQAYTHPYTLHDLTELQKLVESEPSRSLSIITTRKDAVKLSDTGLQEITKQLPLFYVPIEVDFLKNGGLFDKLVLEHMASFRKL